MPMERFKKSLKIAITEKVEGLRLVSGKAPCLLRGSSEQLLDNLNSYPAPDLENLIKSLMPHIDAVEPSQAVQGELAIVNFGELKLIGQLGPEPRLYVFIPPQGNQLFRQVWNQLTEVNIQAPPTPVEPSDYQEEEEASPEESPTGDFSIAAVDDKEGEEEPAWSPDHNIAEEEAGFDSMLPPLPNAVEFSQDEESSMRPIPQLGYEAESDANEEEANDESEFAALHEPTTFKAIDQQPTVYTSPQGKKYELIKHSDEDYLTQNFESSQDSSYQDHTFTANNEVDDQYSDHQWQSEAALYTSRSEYQEEFQSSSYQQQKIHFGPDIPGESIDKHQSRSIDKVLKVMIESGASDLHLTLGKPVSLRIDGEIQRMDGELVDEEQMQALLLPIMPLKNQEEFIESNDTDFGYEVAGLARFRVNVFRDINGVGAVLRQIPDKIPSADDLDLPDAVRRFCDLSKGLVLVTGPTGSGKSTTLAAMIDLINNNRNEHILTIEDPIEFVHEQKNCLVNQREVHRHTKSFSKALRAALREDPDIILIGEMRDLETIAIAIETAETGHLVFATLHTNTAISTIDRLIDQFPAEQQSQIRIMLAESLKGVVSQTLVKKKNGGRIAAHEILVVDRAVSSLIREANTHMIQNHMQTQKAKGNILLNDALLNLVSKGLVAAQDAYHRAVDKDGFLKILQQKGLAGELSQVS